MTSVAEVVAEHLEQSSVAGLSNQIARQLLRALPAASVKDLSSHVTHSGPLTVPYVQRAAGDALIAAVEEQGKSLAGERPHLVHALRTLPQQYVLWKWYLDGSGVFPAGMPGSSAFENGVAICIEKHEKWTKVLGKHNWHWRGPNGNDPGQFNYHGPQNPELLTTSVWAFQRVWNAHNPNDLLALDGVLTPQVIARLERSPAAGF